MKFESEDIVNQLVKEIPNMQEAVRTSVRLSGKTDKQIYLEIEMDGAQWSRFMSGQINISLSKIPLLQRILGNDVILRNLAKECGYSISPSYEKLEEQNKEQRAQIKYLENKLKEKDQ